MNVDNPQTYISIISSALLIISEILPYLPCASNGISQIIINSFNKTKCNKLPDENKNQVKPDLCYEDDNLNRLKKLEKDLQQVMKDLKANKTLEIDLNMKLNEIINELKRINAG